MEEGVVCRERRNLGCHMVEGPVIHGSIRIENVPGGCWCSVLVGVGVGVGVGPSFGEKVSRNVVSPFRC